MSFTEYKARGNKTNPKERLEELIKARQFHGYDVPNIEGYEQFGPRFGGFFSDMSTSLRQGLFIDPYKDGKYLGIIPYKGQKNNRAFKLRSYKNRYANTRKLNDKTGKYELWDTRTESFFDQTKALKYVNEKNDEAARAYYLKTYGTETPQKDIEYLEKVVRAEQKSKPIVDDAYNPRRYRDILWERENLQKIEGTDQTVGEKKRELYIDKLNKSTEKYKKGTSFEKAEIEAKNVDYHSDKKYNERIDKLEALFINNNKVNDLKINQNEANLDLTLTNGTK